MALVLGIEKGEKIYIGDNISIELYQNRRFGWVVAIEAPKTINVARDSILTDKDRDKREKAIERDKNGR